jgi:membrane associated rhomboid family serine protease
LSTDFADAAEVELFRSAERKPCLELALVLRATGIPHRVDSVRGAHVLVVPGSFAERAHVQLEAYIAENRGWPPPEVRLPKLAGSVESALVYCAVILSVFFLERGHAFALDWWSAGKVDARLVREGKLWRCATALTLHTDLHHLASNLFFGALFGGLLCQSFGVGLTWFTILASGFFGNLANAWIQSPDHTSVGASTAVFGALGAQVAFTWLRKTALRQRAARRWLPVLMGLVMLGYLGFGGERTDFMAHVAGFACGFALGAAAALLTERVYLRRSTQAMYAAGTLLTLAAAWALALT